jgi:hypothetical protein
MMMVMAAVSTGGAWAVDSDSEADYNAWVAAHRAAYDAKQAQQTTMDSSTLGSAAAPMAAPSFSSSTCSRTVGPKGSGATYSSVMDAVSSIPNGNSQRCVIYIAAGTYT